ncbi:hypothetical protein Pmani_013526 [Petrolisthes manimaculis]|uniref:Uncharacterized protein n=1 Tax=Petrolisthes manimaculis TaxID=1843537 RepID=A0AAE1PUT2_9EUCA|nr:hypothetical protein Pmani_013526 [Petrolisthes manimaculis]
MVVTGDRDIQGPIRMIQPQLQPQPQPIASILVRQSRSSPPQLQPQPSTPQEHSLSEQPLVRSDVREAKSDVREAKSDVREAKSDVREARDGYLVSSDPRYSPDPLVPSSDPRLCHNHSHKISDVDAQLISHKSSSRIHSRILCSEMATPAFPPITTNIPEGPTTLTNG